MTATEDPSRESAGAGQTLERIDLSPLPTPPQAAESGIHRSPDSSDESQNPTSASNLGTFSLGSFSKLAETATKTGGLALAALYVTGLLAVNLYMVDLEVSDFSILKLQYVFTGALVVVLWFVTCLGPCVAAWMYDPTRLLAIQSGNTPGLLAAILVCLLFPAMLWAVSIPLSELSNVAKVAALFLMFLPVLFAVFPFFVRRKAKSDDRHTILFVLLPILSLLSFLPFFVFFVYARVPSQFGGGKPIWARLLVSKDAPDDVGLLGIPLPPEAHLSYPVEILHEGENVYIVRDSWNVVQVAKSMVLGVRPKLDDIGFTVHLLDPTVEQEWGYEELYAWQKRAVVVARQVGSEEGEKVLERTTALVKEAIKGEARNCREDCRFAVEAIHHIYIDERKKLVPEAIPGKLEAKPRAKLPEQNR